MRELQQKRDRTPDMETRITRVLEKRPNPEIPADFAARVSGNLPAEPSGGSQASHYGEAATVGCAASLLLALLLIAPYAGSSLAWTVLQYMLCAQFVCLLLWLGLGRQRLT